MFIKKCITMSFCTIFLVLYVLAGFNILVDPFGVFGDMILDWYSYDITNNPKVSKISYLDKHYTQYDSYILGSPTSSSYSVPLLNQYMDAKFYNLFTPDYDMYDISHTASYVIEHYKVKNLVINMDLRETTQYNIKTEKLHYNVEGSSVLKFYLKYLFANPTYSIDKIKAYYTNTYLPQSFDIFNANTGAYDQSLKDVDYIDNKEKYLANNPSFTENQNLSLSMTAADEYLNNIAEIKSLCDKKGITFTLIISPNYYIEKDYYNKEELKSFWTRLSTITNFWDFSFSTASTEPRYFYDENHFRNALGNMILAKIYNDPSVYTPEDLGYYVTSENVAERIGSFDNEIKPNNSHTKDIAILMYHHISDQGNNAAIISQKAFEAQMKTIYEAGYTSVSFDELINYVEKGVNLPDKSVVITFDDGYSSNYEIAYPILKKYNLKATIFVIGSFVGSTFYKDTDYKITPHFSYAQAKEMVASGLISIQSHTYDMHQSEGYEQHEARQGVLKLDDETEENYIRKFCSDFGKSQSEIEDNLKKEVKVLAYPNGMFTPLNQVLLNEMGIKCTLTTKEAMNTLIKGLPQSLYGLNRYNISDKISPEELLKIMKH